MDVERPKLEGTVAVGEGRRLGFAEFGSAQGRTVFWLHGTPGARRQVPVEARAFAERNHIRLIGVDRPGIGSSTPHIYENVLAFSDDLRIVADTLGVDRMALVGLSGGGPYTLAAAYALRERVVAAAVLGGVAPVVGPEAIDSNLMKLGAFVAPALQTAGVPIGVAMSAAIRVVRPFASPIIDLYGRLSPEADRRLLARPEFKAMFLDDLLNGSRRQISAPFSDIVVFTRDWGFRVSDVKVPVRWWHGDTDHIIPIEHGLHMVDLLPDARFHHLPGESHLGGLGASEEILTTVLELWDQE
ncbi:alpha/beta fold hydrolase [Rhodococcus sp. AB351]|uniref:alpha/beta fold hydrolase n=1 Tax=Rhodococcus sp. AB351 TaxID=3413280 RepID=UPI003C1C75A5